MNIEYKLLDNQTGVILTRQPQQTKELSFTFLGAPSDATAIFTTESGDTLFRKLSEGCSLPVDNLKGVICVTVAVLGAQAQPPHWICEEFVVTPLSDGALVSPNDMNLPQKVVDLQLENQELRESYSALNKHIKKLEERFEKLLEGYDLV